MPGMMDTILDIGVCERTLPAIARISGDAFALGDLRPAGPDVRHHRQRHPGCDVRGGPAACRRRRAAARGGVPRGLRRGDRSALPAEPARPGARGGGRGLRLVALAARAALPRLRRHLPRPRHRGRRAGDGLRQPRRRSGTGVAFTRDPATGAPGLYGDFLLPRPGRGRGGRRGGPLRHRRLPHPGARGVRRPGGRGAGPRAGLRRHVRHRVHRERPASSGCSRPGAASAPRTPRSASPWT